MPRLPTILVIGSQVISTRSVSLLRAVLGAFSVAVIARSPRLLVAGTKVGALDPPLRFLVHGACGDAAQRPDDRAVHATGRAGHPGAWRLVHERHELVREPWHRAGDADAAHVGAAADAVDPAPLGHVALDHRTPAAQLDQALGRAVLDGEVALLVVAGPVA